MRKIKTFNVDEEIYKQLIHMFKEYGVNASLSAFVSNCLGELLAHLTEMEKAMKNTPNYKVPMSFIIGEIVKSLTNKKTANPIVVAPVTEDDFQEIYEDELLTKWEDEYEAQQMGIPVQMYAYIKEGGYILAANKQFLIEEKTGRKVIPIGENGFLAEIKEG